LPFLGAEGGRTLCSPVVDADRAGQYTLRTRGDAMRRYWALTLALLATLPRAATAGVFPDVPFGHWAYSEVEKLASLDALLGYPDGCLRGGRPVGRDEWAAAILQLRPAAARAMLASMPVKPEHVARWAGRQEELRSMTIAQSARHDDDMDGHGRLLEALDTRLATEAQHLTARLDALAPTDLGALNARLDSLGSKVNSESTRLTVAAVATNDLAARHASDMAALTATIDALAGAAATLQPRTKALEDDVAALLRLFGRQNKDAKVAAGDVAGGGAAAANLADGAR